MELDSALTIQVLRQENSVANNYPVLLYSEAKKHKPDSETITSCCSICLADYKDTDWMKLLPDCGHLFHRDCIDRWLQVNLSCPMCRNSPLPTPLSTPLAEVTPLATRRD
ncbi:RING-H2 finger protein ATL70 [Spatholobus suberectus]|nr:RING-H2 finger protein ATL70 [Spatholobus suberectus]